MTQVLLSFFSSHRFRLATLRKRVRKVKFWLYEDSEHLNILLLVFLNFVFESYTQKIFRYSTFFRIDHFHCTETILTNSGNTARRHLYSDGALFW